MDNSEIVIVIESAANTTPLPLLPSSQTHERDTDVPSWSKPLCTAIEDNNWDAIKDILDRVPEAINGPVGLYNDTPLNEAVSSYADTHIIENLINLTPTEKLSYSTDVTGELREPVIHESVYRRQYSTVKLLISKNPALLNSPDSQGRTPVHTALYARKMEMANYLLKLASTIEDEDFELDYIDTLLYAIKARMYDFIYSLIRQIPKLELHDRLWNWLIEECDDFPCRSRLNILQSFIYSRTHIDDEIVSESLTREWTKANSRYLEIKSLKHQDSRVSIYARVRGALRVVTLFVLPFQRVRLIKLKHHQTHRLVNLLTQQDRFSITHRVFCSAVHNGISDIVKMILEISPSAIGYEDEDGNNALQFAVSHRDGKTLRVLYDKIRYITDPIISSLDNNNNNILHLVAKIPRQNQLGTNSGVVLQLQHEFQWYKFMENILPFEFKFKKNSDKKIPSEVFNEEHRDMLKSESEWMTSMANSCMVAGSLIAAVVFAAAITLPGGNNDDGFPNFSTKGAFKIFALSDAFALVSSLTAVVTFLSIFTTRFTVESFQYDLPNRLILGLLSLLLSVIFLMIAFCTAIYLLFKDDYNWIMYPTVAASFVPVFFFAYLQVPSLLNVIKSTYGHDIFKDDNVVVFKKKKTRFWSKKVFLLIFIRLIGY